MSWRDHPEGALEGLAAYVEAELTKLKHAMWGDDTAVALADSPVPAAVEDAAQTADTPPTEDGAQPAA